MRKLLFIFTLFITLFWLANTVSASVYTFTVTITDTSQTQTTLQIVFLYQSWVDHQAKWAMGHVFGDGINTIYLAHDQDKPYFHLYMYYSEATNLYSHTDNTYYALAQDTLYATLKYVFDSQNISMFWVFHYYEVDAVWFTGEAIVPYSSDSNLQTTVPSPIIIPNTLTFSDKIIFIFSNTDTQDFKIWDYLWIQSYTIALVFNNTTLTTVSISMFEIATFTISLSYITADTINETSLLYNSTYTSIFSPGLDIFSSITAFSNGNYFDPGIILIQKFPIVYLVLLVGVTYIVWLATHSIAQTLATLFTMSILAIYAGISTRDTLASSGLTYIVILIIVVLLAFMLLSFVRRNEGV